MADKKEEDPSRFIRLENKSDGHNKFYEVNLLVEQNPNDLQNPTTIYKIIVSWGAIGHTPTTSSKYIGTNPWTARNRAQETVNSKVRKGYKVQVDLTGSEAIKRNNPALEAHRAVRADEIIPEKKKSRLKRFSHLDIDEIP